MVTLPNRQCAKEGLEARLQNFTVFDHAEPWPCRKPQKPRVANQWGFQQAIFDYHDQRGQFCSRIFNVEWLLLLDVRIEGVAGVLPEKPG